MKLWAAAVCYVSVALIPMNGHADQLMTDDATLTHVVTNGGTDSANAGTSCVRLSVAVSSVCPNGWIAIKDNNKQLLSTALAAKASASVVWLYYDTNWGGASFHCPGLTFTPCSVISIAMK